MSSTPTPPATEQRLLAAIVFSDVAGFSSRVEAEETATLDFLERDFTAMRRFSAERGGTVIKSTGDGLMLYFTSAVEAVEWALQTQRHFAEQATTLPAKEVLRHRIGIHLGDVFVSAGDVMGDGVNVAARVQAEARPGGICISQVVYGVVKNKLQLDVVRLEPRKLKNINEVVPMYHVLLAPPAATAPAALRPQPKLAVTEPAWAGTRVSRLTVMVAVLALGAAAAAAFLFYLHREHLRELAESEAMRDALGAAVRPDTTNSPAAPVAANAAPPPGAEKETDGATRPGRPAAAAEIDFLQRTTARPAAPGGAPGDEQARAEAIRQIRVLDTWRSAALSRFNRDHPLSVPPLRGPMHQVWTLFSGANGQLYFAEGGAVRPRAWEELRIEVQAAIVLSLLRNAVVPPGREVVRGAEAFAFLHGLPELAAALARE